MSEIITPSGRSLLELKRETKAIIRVTEQKHRKCLDHIAQRELKSYAPWPEEANWTDLLRESWTLDLGPWTLDPDKSELASYSSERGSFEVHPVYWTPASFIFLYLFHGQPATACRCSCAFGSGFKTSRCSRTRPALLRRV
ncbi:hypothetical protein SAMN06265373_1106 [Shimia sagamensis]|uniref:Uncharacterized protein n=1 Tax=Shimia sagamensis TaxID=1566352 RepID=A0ABY1PIP9_9RHOB|nr:hypothetical protein SAMN06265373_1106 [Shimia sagamensis]